MKVQEILEKGQIWSCPENCRAREAAGLMAQKHIGSIPVLDSEGRLEGILTDRDLVVRLLAQNKGYDTPVYDLMSTDIHVCRRDDDIRDVETLMRQYSIHRVPVVDDENRLEGFVSFSDLVRHIHGRKEEHDLVGVLESIYQSVPTDTTESDGWAEGD